MKDPHAGKVTWAADDHTVAKHKLLESYLGGWFPILGRHHGALNYIDGFAGPGEYERGEDGSPIVALRVALHHKLKLPEQLRFLFLEASAERAAHLEEVIRRRFPALPGKWTCVVSPVRFNHRMSSVLDDIEKAGTRLAPTLVFVDPFGFSEFPMETLRRVLRWDRCELFITFMSSFVGRFLEEDRAAALNDLFGSADWKAARPLNGEARVDYLVRLYERQLTDGPPGVLTRSFEIADRNNRSLYHLVFATKSWRGLEVMKEAMYRLDRTGSYRFSDRSGLDQTTLLDYSDSSAAHWELEAALGIWNAFGGRWAREEEIHRWSVVHSPYVYRKGPLKLLELGLAIENAVGRGPKGGLGADSRILLSPWPGMAAGRSKLGTGSKSSP